uniref:Uncharacterized protein n=1 Tax=Glossina pallidipes TaxID=7398 RepID=A0A1A9ZFG3_GLOPL
MLITGKRELTLTALIPGIDPKETFGYFIHTGFHSAIILFSGVGFFASDVFMFSIFLHALLHRDILMAKFHDLNEATTKPDEPAERSLAVCATFVDLEHFNVRVLWIWSTISNSERGRHQNDLRSLHLV